MTVPAVAEERFHVGMRVTAEGAAHLVLQPLGHGRTGAHPPGAGLPPEEFPLGVLPVDVPPEDGPGQPFSQPPPGG